MTDFKQKALDYHELPKAGKLSVEASKPCETAEDLSLAYTPGVAEPVREIHRDAENAYRYTNKGNLVAVITDGTAVLGLGNVGPLAGKPVMEGKAVLFKRFAGIDVFDIEVNAPSVESFIETVVNIAPTFGGINLEDIAAPHCFRIEKELRERLDIPVFHDDQHGAAIVVSAALLNALELQGKSLSSAKMVFLGAGAAGTATAKLLKVMGAMDITMVDIEGVISLERPDPDKRYEGLARDTTAKSLAEVMPGADVFIGLSAANALPRELLNVMAPKPIVFALANPEPEIMPAVAHAMRDDLVMATGRTDFPNQVNNALCFPYLFRGALNARAKQITQSMQIAMVEALAALAREPVPQKVLEVYGLTELQFGRDYIIPKPLDPRLSERIPPCVAEAWKKEESLLSSGLNVNDVIDHKTDVL
jgi:malate dehydrogenase (oxaloacetate-decarboxylating)(NADP+)